MTRIDGGSERKGRQSSKRMNGFGPFYPADTHAPVYARVAVAPESAYFRDWIRKADGST